MLTISKVHVSSGKGGGVPICVVKICPRGGRAAVMEVGGHIIIKANKTYGPYTTLSSSVILRQRVVWLEESRPVRVPTEPMSISKYHWGPS